MGEAGCAIAPAGPDSGNRQNKQGAYDTNQRFTPYTRPDQGTEPARGAPGRLLFYVAGHRAQSPASYFSYFTHALWLHSARLCSLPLLADLYPSVYPLSQMAGRASGF